jgi:creatinine amidohydrolase/Fe(II)-dependent formamide hydrolase-like protein
MQLQLSTWQEIELYLERSKAIVIPIGSTEQHGPNGMIGTDVICPEIVAKAAGQESGLLVGPTFNVGIAQHHMGFPGSMTLRPSTMIASIVDWVNSLAHHGFTRIYFFNGHGGNTATINAAFAEIYAQTSIGGPGGVGNQGVKCKLKNWWEFKPVFELCIKLYGKSHGSHATPSEVAMTYFAYPDHLKNAPMEPKVAPNGSFTDAADYRKNFPDGRIGSDPSLATVEDGKKFVDLARRGLIEDFEKFAKS